MHRTLTIQWTAGEDFRGHWQQSRGRFSGELIPDWKKTAEAKKNKSRNCDCWNCNIPNHRADQCPKPLLPEMRAGLEGSTISLAEMTCDHHRRQTTNQSEARAKELESSKRTRGRADDEDRYLSSRVKEQYTPNFAARPKWFAFVSPSNRMGERWIVQSAE